MKKLGVLTISLFFAAGIALADSPKDADPKPAPSKPRAAKKAEKSDPSIAAEIEELRQAIQSQQEQLQFLKEELAKRDRQIDEAREAAAAANARAAEASTKAVEAVNTSVEVRTTAAALNTKVSDLKASNEVLKTTVAAEAAQAKSGEENPSALRYKGINFIPGGFIAAESVWRQRGVSGDINTPFTGIPFGSNPLSKTTEFNATGRQSRLTFLADGKIGNVNLTGYYELDWLGACSTSNNRQSNSYCMRQRQIWGSASTTTGWYIAGGQMWSLATEYKKGLKNRDEAIPMTIDPQYVAGFTWARQYGFRVVKSFNDKFSLGFSVEGPQTTFGGRGAPTSFFINAPGNAGGLFNPSDGTGYTVNAAPDFIIKAAADPGWGHYELFGVISTFRARVYPCSVASVATPCSVDPTITAPSALHAFNDTRSGGGLGVNIRVPLFQKKLDAGVHFFGGDGVGRYSSSGLADVTARPNGTLAPIRGGSALGSLEFHPNSKLDIYLEGGGEYAFRTAYVSANKPVGYGSPFFNNSGCNGVEGLPSNQNTPNSAGTCNGDVRNVIEGTLGFWHKLYNGPKGGLRWGIQYSYLVKNTWSGNNSAPNSLTPGPGLQPKAIDNMIFTSFRYYIP